MALYLAQLERRRLLPDVRGEQPLLVAYVCDERDVVRLEQAPEFIHRGVSRTDPAGRHAVRNIDRADSPVYQVLSAGDKVLGVAVVDQVRDAAQAVGVKGGGDRCPVVVLLQPRAPQLADFLGT